MGSGDAQEIDPRIKATYFSVSVPLTAEISKLFHGPPSSVHEMRTPRILIAVIIEQRGHLRISLQFTGISISP